MKKAVMDVIAITALAYLCVLIFLSLNQRNMMYHPDTNRPDPAAYGAANVEVITVQTKDGLSLNGWFFPPVDDKPTILYYHGNASNIANRYEKITHFLREGYGVLLAGYRGYGGNPGKPSEQGFYNDARAYISFLHEFGISNDKIVIYGESIGSGVAVQMAAEQKPMALILEAPFTSIIDVAQSIYFYVPVKLLLRDRFDSLSKIGNVKAPLLIIHGTADKTVPINFGLTLSKEANPPKRFISITGAGHGDLYDYGAATHVLEFLGKIESPSGTAAQ